MSQFCHVGGRRVDLEIRENRLRPIDCALPSLHAPACRMFDLESSERKGLKHQPLPTNPEP